MLDFVTIDMTKDKKGTIIYPEFIVNRSNDLMVRGHGFYAVWDEERGLWSTDERDIQRLIDKEIFDYASEVADERKTLKLLRNFSSNKWKEWQQFCKSFPDNYQEVDAVIKFSNQKIKKSDYVTRSLNYPLEKGPYESYDRLMSVLYDPEEREKLEWAVGAIINGDSKWIQKFIVLYGGSGTGKSTFLNILQDMFPGYYSLFDAKDLGSNDSFSLESLKDNKLIGIQHDGDLSRIEDNTKLNSIVSHEEMSINEKFKSKYKTRFRTFLFMGTNTPVKITDSKSGLLRRLIDVTPTGDKLPIEEYNRLIETIRFEYPAIAYHCLEVYKNLGPHYYDKYIAVSMIQKTNDFFNFIEDNLDLFLNIDEDGLPLRVVWSRYKQYCEDANIKYPASMRVFKDELKNYFEEYKDRHNGQYSVYFGFLKNKFVYTGDDKKNDTGNNIQNNMGDSNDYICNISGSTGEAWLKFDKTVSEFDDIFKDCLAQYAKDDKPSCSWDKCKTTLKDLDTRKTHYMLPPENTSLVVVDFDLKNEKGEKDLEKNLEAASKWPQTYAELSKSGCGVHLHYYYSGDVHTLSHVFGPDIEIKVFKGKSSLRRALTKCNDIPIATISSGLPLREVKNVVTDFTIKSERMLREQIKKNLRKEIHPNTKPSIDFIHKILEDTYNSGLKYDVRDLRPAVQTFAMSSSHQADYCLRMVSKMKFCSEEPSDNTENYEDNRPILFYDVEVFPNLFIVCWKKEGKDQKVVKMINPKPSELEELRKFRLIGFNNRKYDNHMVYGRMMGYTEEQLFNLSQRIIVDKDRNAFFGEAYNLSYTDIYDFLSASNKMSLKKWEIKLGIHHQEFNWPWDKPVPKEKWMEAADYCANDVIATEETFNYKDVQADWIARQILALLSGLTVNDTTNNHTTKIICGNDKNPQSQFIYTDLSTIFPGYEYNPYGIDKSRYLEGTKIVSGKSIYRGEDPGEGGYVSAKPGIYLLAAVLDVASMHPHSAMVLNIFGDKYTKKFKNIVEARVLIKHKDYEAAKVLLESILDNLDSAGVLDIYLNDPKKAKALANALKTAINSVYGLTSASFDNKLRDPRNIDNIVAKYGALFMINLKHEVQDRGYKVIHIKTDSIKIANATPEIIQFVMDYGKEYGYTFEHESTYEKMCLVNDAVYIARYASAEKCQQLYGYIPENNQDHPLEWTATGTQFQVPYVFKTLFSKEPIEFEDLCETKSVTTALYLDFNEDLLLPFITDENGETISPPEDDPRRHNYRFVGKVGSFCPIQDGYNGGVLLREGVDKNGNQKFSAATGTKKRGKGDDVYRWMEAEVVKANGLQDKIDLSYYNALVDDAVDAISEYGDFERFVSDDPLEDMSWMEIPEGVGDEMAFEDFPMNKTEMVA